jgi:hypothetical protein
MVTSVVEVELTKNCVSGSDFGKVWFQFQFRLRFRLQKISSTVLKNVHYLAFSMLEATLASQKGDLAFLIF